MAKINHVVSVGGGTSSTLELPLEVIRKYGKENTYLVIAALKGEHPDLWRMVEYCEQLTGLPVTRVSYNALSPKKYIVNGDPKTWWDIWEIFNKVKFIGNNRVDPCSRILKRETMKRYIQDNFAPENTVLHVGITKDEIERTVAIYRNWQQLGYTVEADLTHIEQCGTSGERAKQLIDFVPELYKQGFTHNNCAGFCVKAGKKHMARLLWFNRSLFYYHALQEKKHQERFNHSYTCMKNQKMQDVKTTLIKDGEAIEIIERKQVKTPLNMIDFAKECYEKWEKLEPGQDPFNYDDFDDTPACSFCDSMA